MQGARVHYLHILHYLSLVYTDPSLALCTPMYVSTLVKRPRYVLLNHGADGDAPSLVTSLNSSEVTIYVTRRLSRCSSSNA